MNPPNGDDSHNQVLSANRRYIGIREAQRIIDRIEKVDTLATEMHKISSYSTNEPSIWR